MVFLDIPAKVHCDEPGCPVEAKARLCLLTSGGFGFEGIPLWQFAAGRTDVPVSHYVTLCPKHAKLLITNEPGPKGKLLKVQ